MKVSALIPVKGVRNAKQRLSPLLDAADRELLSEVMFRDVLKQVLKARGLVEAAARVTVVSPAFAEGFDALADIERIVGPYAATHMARKMWRSAWQRDSGSPRGSHRRA